jgi:large subunit ribosomal protein L17
MQDVADREVVKKLFDTLAPRFAKRPGGYTRLLRIGFRRGDAAEVAQVELVGSEFNPRAAAESQAKKAETAPKTKGVGGRLRAAAERLRGKKSEAAGETDQDLGAADRAAKRGGTKSKGTAKARRRKSDTE